MVPGSLTGIAIDNIGDLLSHEIVREAGATLPVIRYLNGGVFRFLYTDEGAVKEFSGEHLGCTISEDNKVTLWRWDGIPES
jgi:hypothetical protein